MRLIVMKVFWHNIWYTVSEVLCQHYELLWIRHCSERCCVWKRFWLRVNYRNCCANLNFHSWCCDIQNWMDSYCMWCSTEPFWRNSVLRWTFVRSMPPRGLNFVMVAL